MARELENAGLAGDNGEESTLLRGTTELILREGPHWAPFGERGDPHPASPKGRGERKGSSLDSGNQKNQKTHAEPRLRPVNHWQDVTNKYLTENEIDVSPDENEARIMNKTV